MVVEYRPLPMTLRKTRAADQAKKRYWAIEGRQSGRARGRSRIGCMLICRCGTLGRFSIVRVGNLEALPRKPVPPKTTIFLGMSEKDKKPRSWISYFTSRTNNL